MSISNSYPTQNPVLNLNFATGSDQFLDSRISFSRADSTPSAVHYWSNEKHLSSLNLTSNSEDFSAWAETNATATANTTAAPDGNTTASTLTGNAGTAVKYVQSNTIGVDDPVISVYVKAGTHSYIQITDNAASNEFANFDLTNGTVGTVGAGATAAIQAVGSTGWYRCLMRVTQTSTAFAWRVVMIDSSTAARQSTTSSTGTVNLWGAMMTELGDLTNVVAYQSSGSQIHREYSSTLKSVSNAGDPRFEYDPTDGQSVGLKIEASATNLFTYSHELNQWSSARSTVDQNSAIGPTGELTADTLRIDGTDTDSHYIYQTPSVTSGTAYTSSAYVKPAGLTHFAVRFQSAFTDSLVIFNATTGAVTSNSQSLSTSTTSVGNGWFRLSATATATSSTSAAITIYACDTDSSVNVATGDSFRGLLITGLQFEAASAPSSLISTSGASATRAADSCSVADFGYTGGPVSVVSETSGGYGYFPVAWELRDSSGSERLQIAKPSSSAVAATNWRLYALTNGVNTVSTTITSSATAGKIAASFDTNDVAVTASGNAVQVDTATNLLGKVSELHIASLASTNQQMNGHIKRLSLFNVALSDTELQAITS